MQGNIPPEAQETLEELQQLQEQAQQVVVQKNEAERSLREAENANDVLGDVDEEATMYREVGSLLVETDHGTATEELSDRINKLEIRVETLAKQEERVESQFEKLQTELQEKLGDVAGGIGGA